jgi:hypothetical protein
VPNPSQVKETFDIGKELSELLEFSGRYVTGGGSGASLLLENQLV